MIKKKKIGGFNKLFAFTLHIQKKWAQVLALQFGGKVYFMNCKPKLNALLNVSASQILNLNSIIIFLEIIVYKYVGIVYFKNLKLERILSNFRASLIFYSTLHVISVYKSNPRRENKILGILAVRYKLF